MVYLGNIYYLSNLSGSIAVHYSPLHRLIKITN